MLNSNSRRNVDRRWLAGAAMLVIAAGATAAMAQSASSGPQGQGSKTEGKAYNYDRKLGTKAARTAQPDGTTSTTTIHDSTEDGHKYMVKLENGEIVLAQIDGEVVAADRVRTMNDKIELLDGDGNVVHTLPLPGNAGVMTTPDGAVWSLNMNPGQGGAWAFQPGDKVPGVEMAKPPPVMLGITMSEPDDDVAKELGVKPSEAIRIDSVIDGLPAGEAGLKEGDVILAIDGNKPVNQEKLREILRGKKAGDVIKLTVASDGETQDVKIKLAAYNAEKLGQLGMAFNVEPGEKGAQTWMGAQNWKELSGSLEGMIHEHMGQLRPAMEEARRSIEEAIKELSDEADMSAEKVKATALEALNAALAKLNENGDTAKLYADQWRRFAPNSAPGAGSRPQVYITPMPGGAVAGTHPDGAQMERLNNALERMEKRLAELEERLDRRQREAEPREARPRR